MDECRRARAIVDRAAAAVGATMADLEQRTANLSEIIFDVTMIGTNALLKSSRLGDRGKGLSVIAQELRSYAAKIVEGVEELPAALREVAAFVARFSQARPGARRRAPDRPGRAYAPRNRVVQGERQTMTDALTRLERETDAVGAMLGEAADRLAGDRDGISGSLQGAVADIEALAAEIDGSREWSAACADVLDGLLRGAYTMASERQIHEAFLGEAASDAPRQRPGAGQRRTPAARRSPRRARA